MADAVNIHATCVAIGGKGILLLGPSGAGKSDLALRLIDEGARLVADDRTLLFVRVGALHARAPATIKGLLEMRGVGIIRVPVLARVRIALAVRLGHEGARLPRPRLYRVPPSLKPDTLPPQITLDARFAATPAKIRAALKAFVQDAFCDGFNADQPRPHK